MDPVIFKNIYLAGKFILFSSILSLTTVTSISPLKTAYKEEKKFKLWFHLTILLITVAIFIYNVSNFVW